MIIKTKGAFAPMERRFISTLRGLLAAIVLISVLCFGLSTTRALAEATFVDPASVNLTFWPGASITSSTPQNAEALLQRYSTTPWICNRYSPSQWLQLEVGQQQKAIHRVRIVAHRYPCPDFAKTRPVGIRIWVGNDPVEMGNNKLVKEIANNKDWVIDTSFEPVPGKYVRVDFTGSEKAVNCEISGLAVYSQDPKALNPGYPISESNSNGAKIQQISGWWQAVTSREGLNLLSEKRIGTMKHIDDQAVFITTADEDATVRIELSGIYDINRIRIGHTTKLGAYVSPTKADLKISRDGVSYYSIGESQLNTSEEYTDIRPTGSDVWGGVRYVKLTIPRDTVKPAKSLTRVELYGTPENPKAVRQPGVPPVPTGKKIAELDIPAGARLSAAVYDGTGRLLRTLYSHESVVPGKRALHWDGKDDFGQDVPSGQYTYRAAYSRISPTPMPHLGNSAKPMTHARSSSKWITSLAVDTEGNWYQTASFDESGKAVRQYLASGEPGWSFNHNGAFGVAVDRVYAYIISSDIGGKERGQTVFRLRLEDGLREPFADHPKGMIVINPKAEMPSKLEGAREFTREQLRWITGAYGIAVDDNSIWVANYREGRVDRFDKNTGNALTGFPVKDPLNVASDPDGTLWVTHKTDRVTHFSQDGKILGEITELSNPWGIAVGGPDKSLYITENGKGRILNYNRSTLKQNWARGRLATPGPVADDAFYWTSNASVASDHLGRYLVADPRNQRLQRFNADGSLLQSVKADFGQPGPTIDPESDPSLVLSGYFQYKVDLETGDWKFTHNWQPLDGKFSKGSSFHRRLANGRDYIYYLNPVTWGPSVYLISEDGKSLRRSAMLGRHWPGVDDLLDHKWKVRPFFWSDQNADGQVQESEITDSELNLNYFATHAWIDEEGGFWVLDCSKKQVEIVPVQGFDAQQNPIYKWDQRTIVVPAKEIPGVSWNVVRPTPDGREVFLAGDTEESRKYFKNNGLYHGGGFAIARFSRTGRCLNLFHVPMQMATIMTDGRFVYAAQNPNPQRVSVYTPEGLLVTELIPGAESGWAPGWMDTLTSLAPFQVKGTDTHHVYTEEVFYSELLHYRFDAGKDQLQETSGQFGWTATQE